MRIADDGLPGLAPLSPLPPEVKVGRRRDLFAALTRIDGWGSRAWREIMGAWRLHDGALVVEELEAGSDDDDRVNVFAVLDRHGLGGGPGDEDATADWALRRAWAELLARCPVDTLTHRPGAAVVATNACWLEGDRLLLRLLVKLPYAGMCCDGKRMARFVRAVERFLSRFASRRRRPDLDAHRRAVAIQRALRAALDRHGLIAFVGDGSRIARGVDGGPAASCRPLRTPSALAATIDLGALGRWRGLGIRRGITAVAGAPYHGKSTLLAAIAAGRDDHPPGDGRELVVADPSTVLVQAEDGRRIKAQDLSTFFAALPGADPRDFSTERASGATSMAASALQAISAGCRLLLVDEDTAASNFLAIDPGMRALLGRTLRGTRTLLEALPALRDRGVSTVLVAGSSLGALAHADRVLALEAFAPRDATARARRLLGKRAEPTMAKVTAPSRLIVDEADCLLGPRHFITIGATEPERPVVAGAPLDLRRCGWPLDPALARGACAAAAWCARLALGERLPLAELHARWESFVAARGVRGLDPFHSQLLALPPWQLVVTVLERLPRPRMSCAAG
jgi:hypothetical protein